MAIKKLVTIFTLPFAYTKKKTIPLTLILLIIFPNLNAQTTKQIDDSLKIKITTAWKGKSKLGINRNVKYACPMSWNIQFLDSLGCLRPSPDSCFQRFKINCFAPGEFPYTFAEIKQELSLATDLKKYCKDLMKQLTHENGGGKILFYEEKKSKNIILWIDIAYEWKEWGGKSMSRQYARYLLRGNLVYEIVYGSRGEDFYTYLPVGLFILNNTIVE